MVSSVTQKSGLMYVVQNSMFRGGDGAAASSIKCAMCLQDCHKTGRLHVHSDLLAGVPLASQSVCPVQGSGLADLLLQGLRPIAGRTPLPHATAACKLSSYTPVPMCCPFCHAFPPQQSPCTALAVVWLISAACVGRSKASMSPSLKPGSCLSMVPCSRWWQIMVLSDQDTIFTYLIVGIKACVCAHGVYAGLCLTSTGSRQHNWK